MGAAFGLFGPLANMFSKSLPSRMAKDITEMSERLNFSEEGSNKDEFSFVALNEDVILVKFENMKDRTRILNLMPWLINQCLFVMLPFIKGQELDGYEFNIHPFWIRIFNIPLEQMNRQMAIDVGKAIGDVVAIG
ncbi:hypothetical protein Goarm_005082 [Gossypium armourianum]|uniref:DUF4283 domain-containing protein n=1 Tax=Gossypium armourianum TaxID=34283 RepID=A0A7J9JYU4_9ROSI|nr:hypothetical protein [Gossypium armourianum]